jgi:predicted transcriptional regulator
MKKRATSYLQKMNILQYTLLFSNIVFSGRVPYFAIKSNQFDKKLEDYTEDELLRVGFQKDALHVTEYQVPNLSRKIFRVHVDELVKEKMLIRIKTRDDRSKYYTITPLGIIHLMKSYQFSDDTKYPHPERNLVILILQTFAQQNVKPYKSIIFEKEKFFDYETDVLDDIAKWPAINFRGSIIHAFTNVTIEHDFIGKEYERFNLEFFITNGFYDNNKIKIANFNIKQDLNIIKELDNNVYSEPSVLKRQDTEIILDDEQFHHYLANLMLCSLIYDATALDYDLKLLYSIRKKMSIESYLEDFDENMKDVPEYFLRILFLFTKHILRYTRQQLELTTNLNDRLRKIQFVKS